DGYLRGLVAADLDPTGLREAAAAVIAGDGGGVVDGVRVYLAGFDRQGAAPAREDASALGKAPVGGGYACKVAAHDAVAHGEDRAELVRDAAALRVAREVGGRLVAGYGDVGQGHRPGVVDAAAARAGERVTVAAGRDRCRS